jgi:hypothetical protein
LNYDEKFFLHPIYLIIYLINWLAEGVQLLGVTRFFEKVVF